MVGPDGVDCGGRPLGVQGLYLPAGAATRADADLDPRVLGSLEGAWIQAGANLVVRPRSPLLRAGLSQQGIAGRSRRG